MYIHFFFFFLPWEEMNFGSKLVQNVLELSVFTCIEGLPLVGRSMVLQTVSSFVWIPGHTSLHSAAREGGTMPGEHVCFVSPGTTGHLCVTLTIALRRGGFMFRAGSVGRLPRFKYSLHHLLLLFPWKRHETLGLTLLICEMQIHSCISLIGLLDY